jgi:nucleoside-diphosphate-sugar epimerase
LAILITGGTGLIGARVAKILVEHGEQVVCFDLQPNKQKVAELGDRVRIVRGDVTQLGDVIVALKESRAERVLHLAYIKTGDAERIPHVSTRVNVLGTDNVFEAARLMGASRVVFASSIGANGLQSSYGERPVTEDDPPYPITGYGHMKVFSEFMGRRYTALYGLETSALRITFVYGQGREFGTNMWLQDYAYLPAIGRPVQLPNTADQLYNFIYVEDVADALARMCLAPRLPHPLYMTGGETATVGELAETVKQYIPGADVTCSETPQYAAHQYIYYVDAARIKEDLGFVARPLKEGVLAHINEVRASNGQPPLGR